jgi:Kef-type K+ transport system membrane component KefB
VNGSAPAGHSIAHIALVLSIVLVAAKIAGEGASRLKQPPVLGELIGGMVLGSLPWAVSRTLATDPSLDMLAQLGVLLLLFEVGLESTVRDLLVVGATAARVATLGTVMTFGIGFGLAHLAAPGAGLVAQVFVGASITATSVGITARVFKDIGQTRSLEARTILGAAVLDDVLGLVVLALVTGWIAGRQQGHTTSALSLAWLLAKTLALLATAVAVGVRVTPRIFGAASRLVTPGALLAVGLSFCFLFSWGADMLGLAPIIGAFAAGLVLEELHSERFVARGEKPLIELVEPISDFLVPIFFVEMGVRVDVGAFLHPRTLALAGVLTLAAVFGKLTCVVGVGPTGQAGRRTSRLSVALGMMPRGEVTLIYASLGRQMGVLDHDAYSAIVVVVVLTTVLTPTALKWSFARAQRLAGAVADARMAHGSGS